MPYKDPARQRSYQREHKRLQRAEDCRTPGQTLVPIPFRLKTAADVLALLQEQVSAVRNDPEAGTLEKARVVGYLAGISLKAMEAGDLAATLGSMDVAARGLLVVGAGGSRAESEYWASHRRKFGVRR